MAAANLELERRYHPRTAGFRSDLRLLATRSPDPGSAPRRLEERGTGASTGRRRAWEALGSGSKSAAPRFVRFSSGRDETRERGGRGAEEDRAVRWEGKVGGSLLFLAEKWFVYHGTCTDKETN